MLEENFQQILNASYKLALVLSWGYQWLTFIQMLFLFIRIAIHHLNERIWLDDIPSWKKWTKLSLQNQINSKARSILLFLRCCWNFFRRWKNVIFHFPQLFEGSSPVSPPSGDYSESCSNLTSYNLSKIKENFKKYNNVQTLQKLAEKNKSYLE